MSIGSWSKHTGWRRVVFELRQGLSQKDATKEGFRAIGVFQFDTAQATKIVVSNTDTDGFVIVDAVQLVAE